LYKHDEQCKVLTKYGDKRHTGMKEVI